MAFLAYIEAYCFADVKRLFSQYDQTPVPGKVFNDTKLTLKDESFANALLGDI